MPSIHNPGNIFICHQRWKSFTSSAYCELLCHKNLAVSHCIDTVRRRGWLSVRGNISWTTHRCQQWEVPLACKMRSGFLVILQSLSCSISAAMTLFGKNFDTFVEGLTFKVWQKQKWSCRWKGTAIIITAQSFIKTGPSGGNVEKWVVFVIKIL